MNTRPKDHARLWRMWLLLMIGLSAWSVDRRAAHPPGLPGATFVGATLQPSLVPAPSMTVAGVDLDPTLSPDPLLAPTPLSRAFTRRWLDGVPCAPPCWEHITPGVTSVPSALQWLQRLPVVDQTSIITYALRRGSEVTIEWQWVSTSGAPPSAGSMIYDANDPHQRIRTIEPMYPHDATFTLGEIIARYGAPSSIRAHALQVHGPPTFYTLSIAYTEEGILSEQPGVSPAPQALDTTTTVYGVSFYPTPFTPVNRPDWGVWQPWEGFKDFGYYCTADEPGWCPASAYK